MAQTGGVFCLEVGSQRYPLLKDAKKIAAEVGFIILKIRPFGLQTTNKLHNNEADEDNENIIILKKPSLNE